MEATVEYLKRTMPDLGLASVADVELSTNNTDEKTERWLKRRTGKITSSVLKDLMSAGRGKEQFGKTAIKAMQAVKYERRTGVTRPNTNNANFQWGHEHEPAALEWYKKQQHNFPKNNVVKHAVTDFDEILFNEPFSGFGDSPDFVVYNETENRIIGVGEIKCPVDISKIEELMETDTIDADSEYFHQLIGHFIGCPTADYVDLVIYDAYSDTGKIFTIWRYGLETDIKSIENRIRFISAYIDTCLRTGAKINEINNF